MHINMSLINVSLMKEHAFLLCIFVYMYTYVFVRVMYNMCTYICVYLYVWQNIGLGETWCNDMMALISHDVCV